MKELKQLIMIHRINSIILSIIIYLFLVVISSCNCEHDKKMENKMPINDTNSFQIEQILNLSCLQKEIDGMYKYLTYLPQKINVVSKQVINLDSIVTPQNNILIFKSDESKYNQNEFSIELKYEYKYPNIGKIQFQILPDENIYIIFIVKKEKGKWTCSEIIWREY